MSRKAVVGGNRPTNKIQLNQWFGSYWVVLEGSLGLVKDTDRNLQQWLTFCQKISVFLKFKNKGEKKCNQIHNKINSIDIFQLGKRSEM